MHDKNNSHNNKIIPNAQPRKMFLKIYLFFIFYISLAFMVIVLAAARLLKYFVCLLFCIDR